MSSDGIKVDLRWDYPQYESGGITGSDYISYDFGVSIKRNQSTISYDPITYYKNSQYIDFWNLRGITLQDQDVISFSCSACSGYRYFYSSDESKDWYISFDKDRFIVNNWGISTRTSVASSMLYQTITNSNMLCSDHGASGTGLMFANQNSVQIYDMGGSYNAFMHYTGITSDQIQIKFIKKCLNDTPDSNYIINLVHVDEYDDEVLGGNGDTGSPVPQQTIYVWVKFDDDYVDLPYINHNHNKDRLLKFEFNSALSGTQSTLVNQVTDPDTGEIMDPGYYEYKTTLVWQCHCFTKSSSTGSYDGIDTNMIKALKAIVDHINNSAIATTKYTTSDSTTKNYTSACKITFEGSSFEVVDKDTFNQRNSIKFVM